MQKQEKKVVPVIKKLVYENENNISDGLTYKKNNTKNQKQIEK